MAGKSENILYAHVLVCWLFCLSVFIISLTNSLSMYSLTVSLPQFHLPLIPPFLDSFLSPFPSPIFPLLLLNSPPFYHIQAESNMELRTKILLDIASGIAHIHSLGYMHRDLKVREKWRNKYNNLILQLYNTHIWNIYIAYSILFILLINMHFMKKYSIYQ